MRRVLASFASVLTLAFVVGIAARPAIAEDGLCVGDGVSGKRIHVWYAWQTQDRYSIDVVNIRRVLADADARLAAVGGQHYRFLCSAGGVVVDKIHVSSPTLEAFKDALRTAGFASTDRIYSAFAPEATLGKGETTNDDRADPILNAANKGPRYSAEPIGVDYFMHETGHNLGAVQNSAPHATGSWHCWDRQDVMCKDDGGPYFQNGGQLQTVCGDAVFDNANRWDCNLDDYYNPHPAPGSYLSSHWNIRDSSFLTPVPTPPPAPGNLRVASRTASSITMTWNAVSDRDGISAYSLEVRRATLGRYSVVCETTALSCTEAGIALLLGPNFEFRVRARDGSGTWGAYSADVPARCSTRICV